MRSAMPSNRGRWARTHDPTMVYSPSFSRTVAASLACMASSRLPATRASRPTVRRRHGAAQLRSMIVDAFIRASTSSFSRAMTDRASAEIAAAIELRDLQRSENVIECVTFLCRAALHDTPRRLPLPTRGALHVRGPARDPRLRLRL